MKQINVLELIMSYDFDTTEQRSRIMKKIKSTETTPEILFRKKIWKKGVRYRKNNKDIPGKPDISIKKYKIAIFIDGSFWHGYDWKNKKVRIKSNRGYWIPKIERNIDRDKKHNKHLSEEGWAVIRFWDFEIKKDIEGCVKKVLNLIDERKKIINEE